MSSNLSRDDSRRLSRGLVDMLHGNVDAYPPASRARIAACPIFKSAELQYAYKKAQPEFVALAGSTDHDHYQLVSLALPVTNNSHGDTKTLRRQLDLPERPRLEHVIDHLFELTATPGLEEALKLSSPSRAFVLEGIQKGYEFIIRSVNEVLAEAGSLGIAKLADASSRLAQGAWVLVQDCKFVQPHDLCFDLLEDSSRGRLSHVPTCGRD